ncbi:TetR/AcrR family transcriptional regulator [Dactylosporangium sp. AC04546]|uniref:TetR/AcrR family transcriptional regulator n=1 Tax=Dactylosporangium sp. AC04546 TaxID=2862460 RepID=UPI001EDE5C56|nr:TetR/AcrR family transcriptional regulator [Dactylosporangium sp. AC04546]WVK85398.1 TetR/AcrR family transcriptional regulator [Dactylosporangium sp. AC04546]
MPRSTKRPSSSARGARARDAILRAATSVFARDGYRGGPLAAVATAADLTQPGLLHHFPTKESLLLAVLEERDREGAALLDGTEEWHRGGPAALDALQGIVERNAANRELVQLFTVLVGESVSDGHPAHRYFADRYARIRTGTADAIRRGQAGGAFRADADAETLASLVLAVMDGLQIQWLLDPSQDMTERFALFADMTKRFLTPATA